MMELTSISFYGRSGGIHIFKDAIRAMGQPRFIRFCINADATSLAVVSYSKISLTSFRVPKNINDEDAKIEIYSKGLIRGLCSRLGWKETHSYRVPGRVLDNQSAVIFDLRRAEEIPYDERN